MKRKIILLSSIVMLSLVTFNDCYAATEQKTKLEVEKIEPEEFEGTLTEENSFCDTYTFTAENAGTYAVKLYGQTANVAVAFYVYDYFENKITMDYGAGTLYKSFVCEEGKEYTIKVKTNTECSEYKFLLYRPNEKYELNGFTQVSDTLMCRDSANRYLFTAPVDGEYGFGFDKESCTKNVDFICGIYDPEGQELSDVWVTHDGMIEVTLEKGQTYPIKLYTNAGDCGEYVLEIAYPEGAISEDTITESTEEVKEDTSIEQQLKDLQDENATLKKILEENGIDYDEN